MKKPIIAMQTDFQTKTAAVSMMHGVCFRVDPELIIDDICHEIEKFNPFAASHSLDFVLPYYPDGTVFVSVVDPGVGTARRASIAKLDNGTYIVTPDNGSLTNVMLNRNIVEIREIDHKHYYPGNEGVHIFHGRDLFAYAAAKLAAGVITFEEVGPSYPISEIVTFDLTAPIVSSNKIEGIIQACFRNFGLVSTNIPISLLEKIDVHFNEKVHIYIENDGKAYFNQEVLFHKSFGFVEKGQPIVYPSEANTVSVAINLGDFVETHKVSCGNDWLFTISKVK